MSAFVLDFEHLRYLVSAAIRYEISTVYITKRQAVTIDARNWWDDDRERPGRSHGDALVAMLHRENVRSVRHRYAHRDDLDDFATEETLPQFRPLTTEPVQTLKACDCFDYQACETDDYDETPAAALVRAIRRAAICALPGYDAAAWSLDEASAAVAAPRQGERAPWADAQA